MPARSPEAIARRKERNREYARKHYREKRDRKLPPPVHLEAVGEKWLVLSCTKCFGFFDVPATRKGKRLPELCDNCCSKPRYHL